MGSIERELPLATPLFEALGARAPLLRPLESLGLKTVGDLLFYFPTRYDDFVSVAEIADLAPGQQVTIQAAVEDMRSFRTRRGLTIVEAVIADTSASMKVVWFNQPYVANTLHPGHVANFSGKVLFSEEKGIYFSSPHFEIVKSSDMGQVTSDKASLVPVYPEARGITSRGIRFTVQRILGKNPGFAEWIPSEILSRAGIPEIRVAMASIHLPKRIEHALLARKRFSFENLFLLQLMNFERKLALAQQQAPAIEADIERIKAILAKLPFALTQSQKQSLWEIIQDIGKATPMNRLLQGDVGSGKTVVAAIAAIIAAEHGYQTAFMAPTEILARQHFETFQKFLSYIGAEKSPIVGLITGTDAIIAYEDGMTAKSKKEELWKKNLDGTVDVIFGTHALIQKSAGFKKLGLVIVDEQHRFGVKQRKALIASRKSQVASPRGNATSDSRYAIRDMIPHFLSMSATPIPRTIMMTVFGDLDVSLITELPAGRKPIETKIILPQERTSAYVFVRKEVKKGRQVFVICPRILKAEEEEAIKKSPIYNRYGSNLDVKSVVEEYEKLSKKIFSDLRVAMLHGQMKAKQKEAVMRAFKEGKTDILVATSVIEVGVDIPNASVMMIEGADRFGLAQLYQFRGRIGRGEHAAYCFILTDSSGAATAARLKAIVSAKNGFELAERDLELRGPGEFFGAAQSGFSDTTIDALKNPELVKISRESASSILRADPAVARYPLLREKIDSFKRNIHQE